MAEVSIHITVDNAGAFQQIITPLYKLRGTMESLNRTGSALSGNVVKAVEALNDKISKLSESMENLAKSTGEVDKPEAKRASLVEKVALPFVFVVEFFCAHFAFLMAFPKICNEKANNKDYKDYCSCFPVKLIKNFISRNNDKWDQKQKEYQKKESHNGGL